MKLGADEPCDRTCDFCIRKENDRDVVLEWVGAFLSCEDCIRLSEAEEELNSNNGEQDGSEKEEDKELDSDWERFTAYPDGVK